MRGKLIGGCMAGLVLGAPMVAWASSTAARSGSYGRLPARPLAHGALSGRIIAVRGSSFTIQTPGRPTGVINALVRAADRLARHRYPYVYGGGHSEAGAPSIGIKGPGYNGRRVGYDCSGSVAAVLAGGGLWPAGGGVPGDAGIIAEMRARKLIARGAGRGPLEVTLYDEPSVHIFMNIDGRFFGTSAGGGTGDARGGPGWLDGYAPDATSPRFRRWHVLPRLLAGSTRAAHSVTFQITGDPGFAAGLQDGEWVRVSYSETAAGIMKATAIAYPRSATAAGTVTWIAPDEDAFGIQTGLGSSMSFATGAAGAAVATLVPGDAVTVTFTRAQKGRVAVTVSVTATPSAS